MIIESETRKIIDEQLRRVGWEADTETLRYSKGTRPQKGHNMAIAEWKTNSDVGNEGYVDYALFVDTKMVATIEAKASYKDVSAVIDFQCKDYSRNISDEDKAYQLGDWNGYKVPFTFATNGRPYNQQLETKSGIWFLDLRSVANAPKALRGWLSPMGIIELLERNISLGNEKLQALPLDLLCDEDGLNLREYQIRAIQAVEREIINGRKNILIAMATGIFYAQGVKTNVLFFTRGTTDEDNTHEVWFYDLRTNMPSFGKTNPLKHEHFADFEKAFEADSRCAVRDERFNVFTREQIAEKKNSLDLGLIRDDSVVDYEDLPNPIELGEEAIDDLQEAVDLLQGVVNKLKTLEERE